MSIILTRQMVEFDFEQDVEKMLPRVCEERGQNQKHRIIVCTHWLLGLCQHGQDCPFLHIFVRSKMKPCKHGKLCKIKNCPLKHVAEEELEECQFYKQGFCCNGPKCARRHKKRMPEECPVEATFDPHINFSGGTTVYGKKAKTSQPNDNFKVTLCTHWLLSLSCPFNEECHYAHGEEEINEGYQPNVEFLSDSEVYDPTANKMDCPLDLPFPTTSKLSYFILQSPDLRSLAVARRRGIYGVAKLMNLIPQPANPAALITPEFSIQWLRSIRLSLRSVAQVKLGTSGMFVGRCATDGRFESRIGLDIFLTTFRKPAWQWHEEMERAEMNIRLIEPLSVAAAATGAAAASSNNSGSIEYYPAVSAYFLPPDVLFAPTWIERAGIVPAEKGWFNRTDRTGKHGPNTSSSTSSLANPNSTSSASIVAAVDFYTGDLPGFVVCAATAVVEEMFRRSLFGLPPQMQDIVIHPNVPLFVFDSQAMLMLGIFYADSPVGVNINPTAFVTLGGLGPGGGSPLPVQFKFRIALECPPIALMDPELVVALGGGNAMGAIAAKETRAIANLFAKRSPAFSASKLSSGSAANKPAGALGGTSGSTSYKAPFKFNADVPIDLVGSLYDIKKKLLGTNASTIIQLVDEVGSKNCVRVRMRGIGSGFLEGQQELQEPLMFSVSADSDPLLQTVIVKVKQLVEKARTELQAKQSGQM